MTAQEYKDKLDKALATVEKKEATIERHKAQAEKKLAKLEKLGVTDLENYDKTNGELFWSVIEYKHKLEDIEGAKEKLKEAQEIAENWKAKYEAQLKREATIEKEIPEVFKEAKKALAESWVEYDIRCREAMQKARQELDFKEFRQRYSYSEQERLSKTDEQFRKIEEAEANIWLLDLYNRVVAITGEITDASEICWGGKCLDGFITGKNGKAVVNTIEAGGYYIQRWHLRTLVKAYK